MVGVQQVLVSGTGVGAGVGSTLLVRQSLDQQGETSILRPSVLWGLGTGMGGMGLAWLMSDGRNDGIGMELLEDYSEAAFTAGLFSAFNPVGGGVQLPSV